MLFSRFFIRVIVFFKYRYAKVKKIFYKIFFDLKKYFLFKYKIFQTTLVFIYGKKLYNFLLAFIKKNDYLFNKKSKEKWKIALEEETKKNEKKIELFIKTLGGENNIENIKYSFKTTTIYIKYIRLIRLEKLKECGVINYSIKNNKLKCIFGLLSLKFFKELNQHFIIQKNKDD